MYFKKMVGAKCYLSTVDPDDAPIFTAWLCDYDVTRYLAEAPSCYPLQAEREALDRLSREHNYCIVDLKTDRLIGICGFMGIDHLNQTAEVGIFIGAKDCWGKGYGSEALSLLVKYGFNVLNFHNIMLKVLSNNERAVRCYERVGFRTFGVRKEAELREGKRHDVVYMDMTRSDMLAGL